MWHKRTVSREVDRRRLVKMSDAVNGPLPSDAGPADQGTHHRNPVLVSVGRMNILHAPVPYPWKGHTMKQTDIDDELAALNTAFDALESAQW